MTLKRRFMTGVVLHNRMSTVAFNVDGTLDILLRVCDSDQPPVNENGLTPEQAGALMIEGNYPLLVRIPDGLLSYAEAMEAE